jgi:hypothetical protein
MGLGGEEHRREARSLLPVGEGGLPAGPPRSCSGEGGEGGGARRRGREGRRSTPAAGADRREEAATNFFLPWCGVVGSDGEGKGGPAGYTWWVCAGGVRKKSIFGRNALQIAIFWYFIVFPHYPLPNKYDG